MESRRFPPKISQLRWLRHKLSSSCPLAGRHSLSGPPGTDFGVTPASRQRTHLPRKASTGDPIAAEDAHTGAPTTTAVADSPAGHGSTAASAANTDYREE